MSLEFWNELINIFVDYGKNTGKFLKKVRKFLEVKRKIMVTKWV